jgi:hypothetical protein
MTQTVREVEYYRLWPGNSGNAGIWDTDLIQISADTPDDQLDRVIREAAARVSWCRDPPAIVGFYSQIERKEPESAEPLSLLEELLSLTEPFRGRMDTDERNTWGRISADAADLRDALDQLTDRDATNGD